MRTPEQIIRDIKQKIDLMSEELNLLKESINQQKDYRGNKKYSFNYSGLAWFEREKLTIEPDDDLTSLILTVTANDIHTAIKTIEADIKKGLIDPGTLYKATSVDIYENGDHPENLMTLSVAKPQDGELTDVNRVFFDYSEYLKGRKNRTFDK